MVSNFVTLVSILIAFYGNTSAELTTFVDKDSKLVGFAEKQWFKNNIPFIEVPDKNIEDVYYYRWASHKRHLRYLHPGVGYSVTEFVNDVGWQNKFGTINDAAGHHIYESRWLRNQQYVKDYINFFARENDDVGNHHYSEWIADAAYSAYLMNVDKEFIKSNLDGFVKNYDKWSDHFEPKLGLYFVSPLWDAQEFSAASVQTKDKFAGGIGYRPSHNSEMYANAIAITKIAHLANDSKTEKEFQTRAKALREAIITHLWDKERNHFYHMQRVDNPSHALLDSREEVGFYPWRWQVPDNRHNFSVAFDQLFDEQGFDSKYGPTTCEIRSKWYDGNQKNPQCCWWNGNSWPYSTAHILSSLAVHLRSYKQQNPHITNEHYIRALHKYTITQYKNNVPYVAECHSPQGDFWVCDSGNHSEHYAHSTYNDNVLGELFGIIPREDDHFEIDPLIPSTWKYFIAEDITYHNQNITVLFDSDGTKYKVGSGMKVYVNGKLAANQTHIGKMVVPIPTVTGMNENENRLENYAANVKRQGYPKPSASFTHHTTSLWQAIDGRIFYDYLPSNRWYNYDSKNDSDWFAVDFGRAKTVNKVSIYVYDDVVTKEGTTECPTKMVVQYHDGSDWKDAQNQVSHPAHCSGNDLNEISFNAVKTREIRVVFTRNTAKNYYVGITELEVWAEWPQTLHPNIYEAEDGIITDALMETSATASGNSFVGLIDKKSSNVEMSGIHSKTSGNLKIKVFYANANSTDAKQIVAVNNLHTVTITYPPTKLGWGHFDEHNFAEVTVPLLKGRNVLIFHHDIGFAELDKIEVVV